MTDIAETDNADADADLDDGDLDTDSEPNVENDSEAKRMEPGEKMDRAEDSAKNESQ